MNIQSKHIFLGKIAAIVLLSIAGGWLFWQEYYFSTILALAGIIIVSVSISQDRKNLIERMGRMIGGIRHSDFSTHFPSNRSNDELNLLMQEMNEALEIFRSRTHETVIEEAETKAWQKLISVLTHEIMNSIAPIISLSETLSEQEVSEEMDPKEMDLERYRIMQQAMETIHRRSKGLLSFVENYRTLTRLPQPSMQPIPMQALLQSIQQLIAANGIDFSWSVYPTQLILNADKTMVEQLLINLLKNAHEACSGLSEEKIEVKAEMVGDKVEITVSDNGQGISPEAIDKIFIPFYSTKASGSGIGLSLCRQIVARHKGKIAVQSDKTGTRFKIEFP